ncbi:unnamed protein product, partial [Medioppia subpectinata]
MGSGLVSIETYIQDLDFCDLYKCSKDDDTNKLCNQLERQWNRELGKKKPRFGRALFRTYALMFTPLDVGVRLTQPVLLGFVVRYFQTKGADMSYTMAASSAAGVVLCSLYCSFSQHVTAVYEMRVGMKMRAACCALMYRKSLRLSRQALGQTTVGQIINMMSNDATRFDEFAFYLHALFVAPLQSALVLYLLWEHLSWACLAGMTVLLLFIPFQGLMGRTFQRYRRMTARLTDTRIRLMNEIIGGMRVIKMYAWERPFAQLVSEARRYNWPNNQAKTDRQYTHVTRVMRKEIQRIRYSSFLKGVNLSLYIIVVRIILFACFLTYILMGQKLSAEAVFVSMAFFNTMRISVTKHFPNGVAATAELMVVIGRVQKFLLLDEMVSIDDKCDNDMEMKAKSDHKSDDNISSGGEETGIFIDNMNVRWNNDMTEPTLRDISLSVKPGQLLAVVGTVGSGKSSLLMSILNELELVSGQVVVKGRVSYAPQESWAFIASVRQNILFGSQYNEEKYNRVVKACALDRDFKLFPFGDKTLVGEKGVSLSGGQKARISLARALYHSADIYLLDDPLSAVDTHVAKHIFQKCCVEYLSDKARVLVTHQIQFLKDAHKILVLNDGKCVAIGSYDELKERGINLMSYQKQPETGDQNRKFLLRDRTVSFTPSIASSAGTGAEGPEVGTNSSVGGGDVADGDVGDDAPVAKAETKMTGSVEGSVYWNYTRAGAGPVLFIITFLSALIVQVLYQGGDFWLTTWTNAESSGKPVDQTLYLSVYSGLIGALIVTALISATSFYWMCMRSSVRLYDSIFFSLLRAPISFFDGQPLGRILNRFTKDTGVVDELLPSTAFDFIISMSLVFGNLVVNAIVSWLLVFPAILLLLLVFMCRLFYIRAARDIKRMDGLSRSPVYSHVNTTLNGLSTIRAFGAQTMFMRQFERHQNDNTSTFFLFICTSRAFGVLMDSICVFYISAVVAFIMTFQDMPGGNAGLILSSALTLTGMTQYSIKCSADLESYMTSVERMLEYSRITPEAELESPPERKPPTDWPQTGEIIFKDMSLQYNETTNKVLKHISVCLKGGEKVGVVGRTGAGKSSMIAALFRLTEPEGQVLIDGVDIGTIGLHDLRSRISIIPQDPVLFTGSMRKNLDPFGEHPDDELWSALEEVQLRDVVQSMPGQLDGEVTEGGGNMSVGQRQLVCLARAILRDNRVLVLDEATANVDHRTDALIQTTIRQRTDALIQTTIRQRFRYCTVITIAHRLNTIIDSDKVMVSQGLIGGWVRITCVVLIVYVFVDQVLDAGQVVEYDIPHHLLDTSDGLFSKLVKQTGKHMTIRLKQMAKQYYYHKNGIKLEEEEEALESGQENAVPPYVYLSENPINKRLDLDRGYETLIIKVLLNVLNITYEVIDGRGQADIGFGGLTLNHDRAQVIDYTYPYEPDTFTFTAPEHNNLDEKFGEHLVVVPRGKVDIFETLRDSPGSLVYIDNSLFLSHAINHYNITAYDIPVSSDQTSISLALDAIFVAKNFRFKQFYDFT